MSATGSIHTVVALASQSKGSSTPSTRSLVVDEERTRPGHWLGLVHCVAFCALTLVIG